MKREYIVKRKTGKAINRSAGFDPHISEPAINRIQFNCMNVYDGKSRFRWLLSRTANRNPLRDPEFFYLCLDAGYLEIDFPDDLMASMWEFFEASGDERYEFIPLTERQQAVIRDMADRNRFVVEPGLETDILLGREDELE